MHIIHPVINMRKFPSEKEEVISQGVFGEEVSLLQKEGSWAFIKTSDDYQGWVPLDSLYLIRQPYKPNLFTSSCKVPFYGEKSIIFGPLLNLPYGIGLKVISECRDWYSVEMPQGKELFVRKGHLEQKREVRKEDIPTLASQFLGTPYIWGGRSSFGFDCSGFVQMLYLQMGIQLPRDSGPQSRDKRFEDVEILESGDLIFWGESREEIRHVGLYIGENQFIHASAREHMPWVRMSSLTDDAWTFGEKAVYPYRLYRRFVKILD